MTNAASLQVTTLNDREITITRDFDAPSRLVYDAYTRPELVQRWLGRMPGWTWLVCEMDVRVGGRYRWVWGGPDGGEMGVGGVYREIVPGERIVNTERFDPSWYEGESIGTVVFTERSGRTTVTTTLRYDSKDIRDAVLKSPATSGMEMGYAILDELLASLPAA